jgi:hypothetical protein
MLHAFLSLAHAADLTVSDLDTLRAALGEAAPGDVLTLAPGTYALDRTVILAARGTEAAPITLRGPGAVLESVAVEALKVTGPHWRIEELTLRGACPDDSDCEHALHIVGDADGTWVRGCTLVDFNAQIKGNGEDVDGARRWPDDVRILGNDIHDTRPRRTSNPVTKIDVVGGQRWRVEANRIADFQKDGGDGVSYAAFLKGHSKDGVFARNLVVCSERFAGGTRVGLSLGGGGTSDGTFCEDGTCTPEHERGLLVNNLIARCEDVGIYLNKAAGTRVLANTLYATAGIDVRFEASDAELDGNLLDARIRERDGGRATLGTNLAETDLSLLFADPDALDFTRRDGGTFVDRATARPDVTDDYCGAPRGDAPDLGAIEYTVDAPCDTTRTHPPVDPEPHDTADTDDDTPDTGPSDTSGSSGAAALASEPGGCGCASVRPTWSAALVVGAAVGIAMRRRLTAPRRPRAR